MQKIKPGIFISFVIIFDFEYKWYRKKIWMSSGWIFTIYIL